MATNVFADGICDVSLSHLPVRFNDLRRASITRVETLVASLVEGQRVTIPTERGMVRGKFLRSVQDSSGQRMLVIENYNREIVWVNPSRITNPDEFIIRNLDINLNNTTHTMNTSDSQMMGLMEAVVTGRDEVSIGLIYVEEAYRGQGVSSMLFNSFIQEAEGRVGQIRRIVMSTSLAEDNKMAFLRGIVDQLERTRPELNYQELRSLRQDSSLQRELLACCRTDIERMLSNNQEAMEILNQTPAGRMRSSAGFSQICANNITVTASLIDVRADLCRP